MSVYIPEDSSDDSDEEEREFLAGLEEEKVLTLTRNEALYLSDSMTLIVDMRPEPGQMSMPVRHLQASALIPVPGYLIHKIGLAVLETTSPDNKTQTAAVELAVADLYMIRECCQSFIKVNKEAVGYNLLRKVYALMLENELREQEEWSFIDDLTKDIDVSLVSPKKSSG